MHALPPATRARVAALAIDGTSATTLLVDARSGAVLAPPKLYNEAQGGEAVARARALAPPGHTARAATSSLAKLLEWDGAGVWQAAEAEGAEPALLHQVRPAPPPS